jgi:hypothetical protein
MYKQWTKRLAATVLGTAAPLLAMSAWSAPITVDGSLGDWGVNPSPIIQNNNAQWGGNTFGSHIADHSVGSNGFVGPGYGGHDFDMVAMYSGIQGDMLYLAFVTGFDIQGVSDPYGRPYNYFMGDVFIDFGSNGGWYYNSNSDYNPGNWDLAFGLNETQDPNATSLNAYTNFGVISTPQDVPGFYAGPYRVDGGDLAGSVDFAFEYGTVDNGMVDNNGNFYHVYEFGYQLSADMLADLQNAGNYSVFSTMNCGNDFLYLTVDVPIVPLPPAAGMVLLGMAGLGIQRRFRKK